VSERDESTSTEEEMRPLPDGGLSSAMPDWLRRPPAWRDLPRNDTPAAEKSLPEPDTSVIDPRELITVDDLPQWLRDIAAREPALEGDPPAPDQAEAMDVVTSPGPTPARTARVEPVPIQFPDTPPATRTLPWIWAMRAAIILIILAIIFYVFIL